MKLLLINPCFPENFWSFSWVFSKIAVNKSALLPPLGLATLAALTPRDWHITIVDENIEEIDFDYDCDLVGVCGMAVQYPRQKEILQRFREKGRYTIAGGSYPSLCPEEYFPFADTVLAGEAERIWPAFCRDHALGRARNFYQETDSIPLTESPTPRYDLLQLHQYQSISIQFSRGCPFRCEFCDIIVTFGRKPRTKTLQQIEAELDLLRRIGVKQLFFVDDNLIGHLPRFRELVQFLKDYQHRYSYPFSFGAEVSLNVAQYPDLMKAMHDARFHWVFLGIETPEHTTLREILKTQNTHEDLLTSVRTIHQNGLEVYASFVIGFDNDDATTFERQRKFILDSGIILASIALLIALPKTPLYERIEQAGRLRQQEPSPDLWNNWQQTNIEPLHLSYEELIQGFRQLLMEISSDSAIARRIENKLRVLINRHTDLGLSWWWMLGYSLRFLWWGVILGGPKRWYYMLRSFLKSLLKPKSFVWVLQNWVIGLSIQKFVSKTFKDAYNRKNSLPASRVTKTFPSKIELIPEIKLKKI